MSSENNKVGDATTYWNYIRVEDLLDLQGGLNRDESQLGNEEVLFITVHQVFELWFKLVIRELKSARDLFTAERVAEQELSGVVGRLERITAIFRVAASHFEVVETLNTREYLEFRNKLMPASGFQSAQMRQMEILIGLKPEDRLSFGQDGSYLDALKEASGEPSSAYERVARQIEDGPTLKDAVEEWLLRTPIDGTPFDAPDADERLAGFVDRFLAAHASEVDVSCERALEVAAEAERDRLLAMYAREKQSVDEFLRPSAAAGGKRTQRIRTAMLFIETYRELPLLAWPREVLANLIVLEQSFSIFRQRHARMVERVIGRRTGTGGSVGVDYLDKTALKYRVFSDLWAIRTLMIRPSATPPLTGADFYDFKTSTRS